MALQLSSLKFQHITKLKRLSKDRCDSVACSDKKVDGKPVNTRLYLFAFASGPLKQNIFKRENASNASSLAPPLSPKNKPF